MSEKILCVDDDPNVLSAIQRQLRKEFEIETAEGPLLGLESIEKRGPYSVVVADMRMPLMDGARFLAEVRRISPDTVRIVLTGNAEQQTAVQAVNEGHIFRFLSKPCPPGVLVNALREGLEHHRALRAQRELQEETLRGCIKILTEILSSVDQDAFGRGQALREGVGLLAGPIELENAWEVEIAAMLLQIGHTLIPTELTEKALAGRSLSEEEKRMLARIPEMGARLLVNIPRLENVARMVELQGARFDGSNLPPGLERDVPRGAHVLRALSDLHDLAETRGSKSAALVEMKARKGWYEPGILASIERMIELDDEADENEFPPVETTVKQLRTGLVLAGPIMTRDGRRLISSGHRISEVLLERIRNYASLSGIREPILVDDWRKHAARKRRQIERARRQTGS